MCDDISDIVDAEFLGIFILFGLEPHVQSVLKKVQLSKHYKKITHRGSDSRVEEGRGGACPIYSLESQVISTDRSAPLEKNVHQEESCVHKMSLLCLSLAHLFVQLPCFYLCHQEYSCSNVVDSPIHALRESLAGDRATSNNTPMPLLKLPRV